MKNFIACRKCANKPGPKAGFVYKDGFVVECECHQKYRERKLYQLKAKQANIWQNPPNIKKTYKGKNSLSCRDQFVVYIENFQKFRDKVVYMHGPNGTQKTSLAMWGAFELIKEGYHVQYILMYRLIELLTASFEKRTEYEIIINKLKSSDLLIIDESFAKDKVLLYKSGYQLPFLDSFLRERIDVADVPVPFQGASIGLITAGLMSMAFMGFIGLA